MLLSNSKSAEVRNPLRIYCALTFLQKSTVKPEYCSTLIEALPSKTFLIQLILCSIEKYCFFSVLIPTATIILSNSGIARFIIDS